MRDDFDTEKAILLVYKRTMSISREVPQSYRGDEHKIGILRALISATLPRAGNCGTAETGNNGSCSDIKITGS